LYKTYAIFFLGYSDAKQMAGDYVAESGTNRTLHARSILSQVYMLIIYTADPVDGKISPGW
jgi:hypothetical protein